MLIPSIKEAINLNLFSIRTNDITLVHISLKKNSHEQANCRMLLTS